MQEIKFYTKEDTKNKLESVGYWADNEIINAINALMNGRNNIIYLQGPAGAGKSFLPESISKVYDCPMIFYQMHQWVTAVDMFTSINTEAVVTGDSGNIRQDGVLALTARYSHKGYVVLCLDEIDKAPESVEYMLLDWLQSGRTPIGPGTFLFANMKNIFVFITSNNFRPMSEPLLRRMRRLFLSPMSPERMEDIILQKTKTDIPLVTKTRYVAYEIAKTEGTILSIQEMCYLIEELLQCCYTVDDVKIAMSGWACRKDAGRKMTHTGFHTHKMAEELFNSLNEFRKNHPHFLEIREKILNEELAKKPKKPIIEVLSLRNEKEENNKNEQIKDGLDYIIKQTSIGNNV